MFKGKKLKILIPVLCIFFVVGFAQHELNGSKHSIGHLSSKLMNETSGLAASGINSGIYYGHNDSGDTSRFFAITAEGKLKSTIYFNGDNKLKRFGVVDCEDIAVGPGPQKGANYVYIGDIGDNNAKRKFITVYRVEEQKTWEKDSIANASAAAVNLKYPDGAKDAESMMVDPIEKLLYIITKRDDSVGIYTAPINYKPNDTLTLTLRGKLHFNGFKPFKWITAADISKDGKQILIKSYATVYYWQRNINEPVWKTLQSPPLELPYKQEKQGEAIAFTPDGKGYLTTSEGVHAPVYYYKIPANK